MALIISLDKERLKRRGEAVTAEVRSIGGWREELHERRRNPVEGSRLPWRCMDGFRIRPSELTVWAGINGHRKSMIIGQAMLGLAMQGERCLIISLEMPPIVTVERIIRQALGPEEDTDEAVDAAITDLDSNLYVLDWQDVLSVDSLLDICRLAVSELGVTQIVVDSLMMLRIQSAGDSALNQQKATITALATFCRTHQVHVHLIAHARKGRDEKEPLSRWDVRGASEIVDQASNLVIVQKVQDAMEPWDQQMLRVAKQRNGEWEGSVVMRFDKKSLQLVEPPLFSPIPWYRIASHVQG